MLLTLQQVLTSADTLYADWARNSDRKGKLNVTNSFSHIYPSLDLSRNEECSEILNDLTNRAVSGARCCVDTVRVEQLKGLHAFREHNITTAAECFTRALAFLDESKAQFSTVAAELYSSRALCLIWLERQAHAVQDCDLALNHKPDSDTAHFRKAVALSKLGRLHEAVQHARSAHDISQSSGAHNVGQDAARFMHDLEQRVASSVFQGSTPKQPQFSARNPMLEVRETASEGRALALADQQRAEAGALLLAEEACVFTVCKSHRRQACMPMSQQIITPGACMPKPS